MTLQIVCILAAVLGTALVFTLIRLRSLRSELIQTQESLQTTKVEYQQLREEYAALEAEFVKEKEEAATRVKFLEEAEKRLSMQFENLANRIFQEKNQVFSRMNREGIESLVTPLSTQIKEFRSRIDAIYDSENRERASLLTEIKQLKDMNEMLGREALNLARALKGDSKVRGNWGEVQLQRILEESGLRKGLEYDVQVSLKNEDGRRLQPDVVVHLPEGKDIVIDSKVSLVAYEKYHSADDEQERLHHLKAHIDSIRTHIKGLGAKNYSHLQGINSLDMVIMFVPVEPALLLAFEHEPELFNLAFSHEILLVGPSTLMATLQIIYNIWRHEYQNRNALEIATEAGKLHDQFVLFVNALEKSGDHLKKALESYELTHKRLVSGRGNLVRRALRLKELGARTKKSLPDAIVEETDKI